MKLSTVFVAQGLLCASGLHYRGSKEAKELYVPLNADSRKAKSVQECATLAYRLFRDHVLKANAFEFKPKEDQCDVGRIGVFPGDLDKLPKSDHDKQGIYYLANDFPKSERLGESLKLFLSFFDDNDPKRLYVRTGGIMKSIASSSGDKKKDGMYDWSSSTKKAILAKLPFPMPKTATYPAFFDADSPTYKVQFETEPFSLSSLTILLWTYGFRSDEDIIAILDSNGDNKLYARTGTGMTGAPRLFYAGTSWTSTRISESKWIYCAISFDATHGRTRFYANGVQLGQQYNNPEDQPAAKDYIATSLVTIKFGSKPEIPIQLPRATIELHDRALTQNEIIAQQAVYQTLFLTESDLSQQNAAIPNV